MPRPFILQTEKASSPPPWAALGEWGGGGGGGRGGGGGGAGGMRRGGLVTRPHGILQRCDQSSPSTFALRQAQDRLRRGRGVRWRAQHAAPLHRRQDLHG